MTSEENKLQFNQRFSNVFYLDDFGAIIWLIVGSEKALLIDTAYGTADIKKEARKITDKPLIVTNTHVHHDHVSGDAQFKEIFAPAKDIFLFKKLKKAFKSKFTIPEKIIPIQEGHIFDLGDTKIEAIHLPGHTPGSFGFLYPKARAFFCGDAISPEMWLHLGHSESMEIFQKSMQKIITKRDQIDTIYISHGKKGKAFGWELPEKLENLAGEILLGEKIGTPCKDIYGQSAYKIKENDIDFLYNPEKLFGEYKSLK